MLKVAQVSRIYFSLHCCRKNTCDIYFNFKELTYPQRNVSACWKQQGMKYGASANIPGGWGSSLGCHNRKKLYPLSVNIFFVVIWLTGYYIWLVFVPTNRIHRNVFHRKLSNPNPTLFSFFLHVYLALVPYFCPLVSFIFFEIRKIFPLRSTVSISILIKPFVIFIFPRERATI